MDLSTILVFLGLVAIGSYIQTLTGFAIALVITGGATAFGLAPISFTANVVNMVALVNILVALFHRHRQVDIGTAAMICVGMLPMVAVGLLLLAYMDSNAANTLTTLLGMLILASGVLLFIRPHPKTAPSRVPAHTLAGAAAGLLSGLFGVGGPPLVVHLYRQPLEFATARSTILALLGIMTVTRIALETYHGNINAAVLQLSLLCIPATIGATLIARRFPPRVSDLAMRRAVFALLTALGLVLIV